MLNRQISSRRASLQAQLSQGETIALADEEWLDNDANLIEESQIINLFKEHPTQQADLLDQGQQTVIRRLREAAGDLPKTVGKKRQRA